MRATVTGPPLQNRSTAKVEAGSTSDKVLRYDVDVDMTKETSQVKVVRLVGPGRRVLDLGCATGGVARALGKQGCQVVGVEMDPAAAERARPWCTEVIVGDLADPATLDKLDGQRFDVILAADILEHLACPEQLLQALPRLLAPDGYLVASIPNVAHGAVRLALVTGRFPYSDVGLLDRTHLRFYTLETAQEMLAAGGFRTVHVERQLHPIELAESSLAPIADVPDSVSQFVHQDPDARVYQYVFVAFPRSRARDPLPALIESLVAEVARLEADRNAHAEDRKVLVEQLRQTQLALLLQRDLTVRVEERLQHTDRHVRHLERQVIGRLQLRSQELEEQLHRAQQESDAARVGLEQLARAQATLTEIYGSRLWRAARKYRRAVHFLRRVAP